jgi:hypothetical protein
LDKFLYSDLKLKKKMMNIKNNKIIIIEIDGVEIIM